MALNVIRVFYHRPAAWSARKVRLAFGNPSQGSKPHRDLPQLLVSKHVPVERYGFLKLHHHNDERISRHRRLGGRNEKWFNISCPYAKFGHERQFRGLSIK